MLKVDTHVEVIEKLLCEITGFSGKKYIVREVARFRFSIGSFQMTKHHEFAVVPDDIFPYCMLLGIDFLQAHDITVDFCRNTLIIGLAVINLKLGEGKEVAIYGVRKSESNSHILLPY